MTPPTDRTGARETPARRLVRTGSGRTNERTDGRILRPRTQDPGMGTRRTRNLDRGFHYLHTKICSLYGIMYSLYLQAHKNRSLLTTLSSNTFKYEYNGYVYAHLPVVQTLCPYILVIPWVSKSRLRPL